MGHAERIEVTVAYGERTRQHVVTIVLPAGSTAADALTAAAPALAALFPEVDFSALALAVWGEACSPASVLGAGDRLELLRPLTADPKSTRRSRADAGAHRKPPGSVFRR